MDDELARHLFCPCFVIAQTDNPAPPKAIHVSKKPRFSPNDAENDPLTVYKRAY